MKTYLDNLITNSKSLLENDPKNESAYKTLIEGAYCKLLLFNNEWVNFREFCYIRTLSIVTINPPIDTLTQEAIEIAIKVINSFYESHNSYLLGTCHSESCISGYHIFRKHVMSALGDPTKTLSITSKKIT